MRRRLVWSLVAVGLATLLSVAGMIAGPAGRTRAYFAVERQWFEHWPLARGKYLPARLERVLPPFAPAWVQVEPHVRMLLDPEDYVSHTILQSGTWEPMSWATIQSHLARGATFVDVGAHIGYYSLKAAPVVGPSGYVIAIEPNPEILPQLRNNIQASGADVISVQPVACSNSEGLLEFFAAPRANTGQTSLSRANASQARPVAATYRVRARALDDIIKEAGVSRVDAVKIDVEGAEFLVLEGAQETLARYRPALLIERVESQLQSMGTSWNEIVAFLHARGYIARRSIEGNVEFTPSTSSAP